MPSAASGSTAEVATRAAETVDADDGLRPVRNLHNKELPESSRSAPSSPGAFADNEPDALKVELSRRMRAMMMVQNRFVANVRAGSHDDTAITKILENTRLNLHWVEKTNAEHGGKLRSFSNAVVQLRERIADFTQLLPGAAAAIDEKRTST
jgi:hypothetical protein